MLILRDVWIRVIQNGYGFLEMMTLYQKMQLRLF